MDYNFVLKEFKKYLNQFDLQDEGINIKVSHSYHVADLAGKLAKRMELTEEETELVKIMGILHDMGRFIQYQKAKMYDDAKTKIDHAKEADVYLFEDGHIKDFKIEEKYHAWIRKALWNHNKLKIDPKLNKKEQFYAKFLRDVDKIDIFRQNAASFDLCYEESLSPAVKEVFFENRLIPVEIVENKSDFLITDLAYLFDINFKESYVLLEETDNLELLLSVIDVKRGFEEEFEEIKKEVRTYLKERVDENVR